MKDNQVEATKEDELPKMYFRGISKFRKKKNGGFINGGRCQI